MGGTAANEKSVKYWTLDKLKQAYSDYQNNKRNERDEQKQARQYYHGVQWTSEQKNVLLKRKQPVMTFNKIGRKIDGIVGVVQNRKHDPKAYPRTPQHEEGADLATAILRYVMDRAQWEKIIDPVATMAAATAGMGGLVLELEEGKKGDKEVGLDVLDMRRFFYDPWSSRPDFSDARYQGYGDWYDLSDAKRMFPDAESSLFGNSDDLTSDSESQLHWFLSGQEGVINRVRIVDCWYQHDGGWCWAMFTGAGILKEGKSYFQDEDGKDLCKYYVFSCNVDDDDDRYGFFRHMKSPQDSINAKHSKLQHIMASNKLFIKLGGVQDIEKARAEYARPDGTIVTVGSPKDDIQESDKVTDFAGWEKLLSFANAEIEGFGPNSELIGDASDVKSGRAIALRQQAGMNELGPFIQSYRAWKNAVYRGVWCAVRQHWTSERYIRVTDNDKLEWLAVNKLDVGPDGQPTIVNQIGALDVDIILDEGPDTINMMQDLYETLQQVAPAVAPLLPPPKAQALVEMLIDTSPLSHEQKKKFREAGEQQDPMQQAQQQLQLRGAVAEVTETEASGRLKDAQAQKALADAQVAPLQALMDGQPQPGQPQEYEVPPELQNMQAMADIEETRANTQHKQAQAFKTQQEGVLAPRQMAMDAANAEADRKASLQQARQRATQAQR